MKVGKFEPVKPANRGLLHEKMHVEQGREIPRSALEHEKSKAKAEGNTKLEREANFALVSRDWNKK